MIKRTLKIIIFLLPLSLLYVWQNTQIFRLAYKVEDKAKIYKDLLERNSILRYNLIKNRTAYQLHENFLSKEKNLEIANSKFIIKTKTEKETSFIYSKNNKESFFLKLFTPTAEAESQP